MGGQLRQRWQSLLLAFLQKYGSWLVAVALLAHFYESADGIDLCYRAQIGKGTCRPLSQQSRKPLPLMSPGTE